MGIRGLTPGFEDGRVLLSGVTQDATSGIYFPASAAEWAIALAAAGDTAGGPSFQWGGGDASGALVGDFGGVNLAAGGTAALYRQAIPGTSRVGVAGTDGATTTFSSTAAGLPDPTTTSYLFLLNVYFSGAPAVQRTIFQYGTTLPQVLALSTTPLLKLQGAALVTGTKNPVGWRQLWFQYYVPTDAIGPRAALVTDQEPRTTTKRATVSKNAILSLNFPGVVGPITLFVGAAAQRSTAQQRNLIQVLGGSLQW